MVPSLSDFITKCTFGGIAIFALLFVAHYRPSDVRPHLQKRLKFGVIGMGMASVILLVHLPRMPVVTWVKSTAPPHPIHISVPR